ncbi:MAG: hypothetical protein AB8B50_10810 [Pirellulaceae bacterium]
MKLKEVTWPALLFFAGIVAAAVAMDTRNPTQPTGSMAEVAKTEVQASERSEQDQTLTEAEPNPWRENLANMPASDEVASSNEPMPSPKPSPKANEPSPDLRPIDVVRIQVASIHEAVNNKDAMQTCFAFASPSNKEATGPVENFTRLIFEPPYAELAYADRVQFGNEYVLGDSAEVLVTTYRAPGVCAGYRFTMSKQTQRPFAECWMTDMVVQLTTVDDSGYEVPGTLTPQTNVD